MPYEFNDTFNVGNEKFFARRMDMYDSVIDTSVITVSYAIMTVSLKFFIILCHK
jgi:hypothetical protein